METTTFNQQKYENYKEQFQRLNKALSNGFNLEAMFIEYAIMEDRTESALRHAELWDAYLKSRRDREPNINSKIRYLQKCAENKKSILHKYYADELLDSVLSWKDERNRLIHALLKQELAHDEILNLAQRGKDLAVALRNCVGNCNRAIERQKGKAGS